MTPYHATDCQCPQCLEDSKETFVGPTAQIIPFPRFAVVAHELKRIRQKAVDGAAQ